jgi:hypothetical protein
VEGEHEGVLRFVKTSPVSKKLPLSRPSRKR